MSDDRASDAGRDLGGSRVPIVVIPGRFSDSASALRYRAVVTARALAEAVLLAGGEPVTIHPWAPNADVTAEQVADRFRFADAVLLPGGGDLSPERYGQRVDHEDIYDVDHEQDAFDFAVAEWALGARIPMLAVCRGAQVVNVLRGGDLRQHMDEPHRHVTHQVAVEAGSHLAEVVGGVVTASCYHHQSLDRLGTGLHVVARAEDGTPEAVELDGYGGWFLGVQWHPEDTAAIDHVQQGVFRGLVDAARLRAH